MGNQNIDLVVFDLDGVLIETRDIHYEALNQALRKQGEQFAIGREEHLTTYNGRPTLHKLNMLTKAKGLPVEAHRQVWLDKQEATKNILEQQTVRDERLCGLFRRLKEDGLTIHVASNSIRSTCDIVLDKLGVAPYVSYVCSNEDVQKAKPNPEIYLRCMATAGVPPTRTLIVEDAAVGVQSAVASGGHLCLVDNPDHVTYSRIREEIAKVTAIDYQPFVCNHVNVLIPMAGAGSRFEKAGYTRPKPLIDVNGKPMIQRVVENIGIKAQFIFVVRDTHYEQYNLGILLPLVAPGCKIVVVDRLTEGAACTTLLAKDYINNDDRLIMANSDQFVEWDESTLIRMLTADEDASMLVFNSDHPKWSYAKVDDNGVVTEVAEKKVISNLATVGIYYWRRGADYVKYAEQMISKNIRVNNEFYVCPVFNEAIQGGRKVKTYGIDRMWGLGTPEDLEYYLKNFGQR